MSRSRACRCRELTFVIVGFLTLTGALTYPLAFRLSSLSRVDNADGQFALWNVAWVARTLVVDPLRVFDANIFYPHRGTLAYSEANLGAGLLAVPAYWLTGNPYTALNLVLLLSFVLGGLGAYYLIRYLSHDRRAAFIAAVGFAFCPYLFGHIPHIQLLMTAGLPFTLLAFHRLVDNPSVGRGVVLGLTMAAQTAWCAYYGIFAALIIVFAVCFVAVARRCFSDGRYWSAVATAAITAAIAVAPLAWPYVVHQRATGFNRTLDAAREYSANWQMYLTSNAFAHSWMMRLVGRWGELLFPGFIPLVFGGVGSLAGFTRAGRSREISLMYTLIAALAFWISLGPRAGLYTVLYEVAPGFTYMRAPSRFGVIVALALSVLAGLAIAGLLARVKRPTAVAALLAVLAVAEAAVPLRFTPAPPVAPAYQLLATLPRGALLELPIYSHQFRFLRARYMMNATHHWMPIVVAYSDHIPREFMESIPLLSDFPSLKAFKRLEPDGVRYVMFHLDQYGHRRPALEARLEECSPYLRRLHADDRMLLYEIIGFPN